MRFLISFVIVFLAWMILAREKTPVISQEFETVPVLVAKKDLAIGTVLTGSEFELCEVPLNLGFYTGQSNLDIIGKTLAYPLVEGEILLEKDLIKKQESKLSVALETKTYSLKKGDKVAIMASNEKECIMLLDNLPVIDVKESQYDSGQIVIVAMGDDEARAINIVKHQCDLSVYPTTGGFNIKRGPLEAAKGLASNPTVTKKRLIQVIEGGEVSWQEID